MKIQNLDKLHQLDLLIADELKKICEKNDIKYFMIAGSLLGAVRHSGIIPWDDDMDFGMLRKDFEKFIEACSKDLDRDKFILQTDMNDKNYPFNFAKIRLKNTEILEEFSSDGNSEKGIFIDIFPFDNVPQNNIDRKFFYSSLYVIKNLLWVKLNYGDSERKKSLSYKVAKLLVKVISVSFLKKLKKKILSRSNGEITTKITTCDGNYGLKKETIDRSLTEKLIMFDVDGHQFPSFSEYDRYLTDFYGNYMKVPDENNRNHHKTYHIDYGPYK